jgi:hypothetical protein
MASEIKPYKISVPDATISRLRQRLSLTTWPQATTFTDSWSYGAPLSDVKRLAQKWEKDFDWRAAEAKLNATLPQFTTSIAVDGFGELEIHFVHQKSANAKSMPLLFVHGWPGSFLEVEKVLPLLTKSEGEDGVSFHVVAPSLPNFGFSEGVQKPGFSVSQYAEVMNKLMIKLGYERYGESSFCPSSSRGRTY